MIGQPKGRSLLVMSTRKLKKITTELMRLARTVPLEAGHGLDVQHKSASSAPIVRCECYVDSVGL